MKRNFIVTLTLVALSLLTVSTGFAQDSVKADVPFAFQVGKSSLPAGTYHVSNAIGNVLLIQGRGASSSAFTQYSSEQNLRAESPKMIFHKYGSTYFLAEIDTASGSSGMKIPESNREKELRASNQGPAAEELVVVAMK